MSNLRLMLKNLTKKKITEFIYFFLIISVRKFNSRKIICKYGILGYWSSCTLKIMFNVDFI